VKSLLALLLFAIPVFAQSTPTITTAVAPGCGPDDSKFDVKTDKNKHLATQPEPGKALLYFLEDDSDFSSTPKPTTRLGLDGQWVGATHGNSYFFLSVDPGEHHLCASWQSVVLIGRGRKSAAAHFTAEPGKAYYFRVQNVWPHERIENRDTRFVFAPLDSDEGQLLTTKFAFATFHPKK
jgi:hypothetical protein